MLKSKEHHLEFHVVTINEEQYPIVKGTKNNSGYSRSRELASFLNSGGVVYTQSIIDQINAADFSDQSNNNFIFEIPSNSGEVSVEFYSSPDRARFWNSTGYDDIPKQDFLEILEEWKAFLADIEFDHDLITQ